MALPKTLDDRDYQTFEELSDSTVAVRVSTVN